MKRKRRVHPVRDLGTDLDYSFFCRSRKYISFALEIRLTQHKSFYYWVMADDCHTYPSPGILLSVHVSRRRFYNMEEIPTWLGYMVPARCGGWWDDGRRHFVETSRTYNSNNFIFLLLGNIMDKDIIRLFYSYTCSSALHSTSDDSDPPDDYGGWATKHLAANHSSFASTTIFET